MAADSRFYDFKGPLSLQVLQDICGFEPVSGNDVQITGVAPSDRAGHGDVCFHEGNPQAAVLINAKASACFVGESAAANVPAGVVPLIVDRPRCMHARAANALFSVKDWTCKGAPAVVDTTARLASGVHVGAGAEIGSGVIMGPNAVIGPGVRIGRNTVIGANASIQCALIGSNVKILAGARIGENGFGMVSGPHGVEDIPQWGRVIVHDDVVVGAGTCIDRGAFDDTIIGAGSKIDNLCQIGHNVIIGRNVVMASFVGISGSCVIGDGVVMGGRVGIADHMTIGRNARLAASAGIFRNVPPGQVWGGTPAKPLRTHLREVAWLGKQATPAKKPS